MKTYSKKRKMMPSSSPPSSPHTPLMSSSPNRLNLAASSPANTSPMNPITPTAPRKKFKKTEKQPSKTALPPPKMTQLHLVFGKSSRQTCKECGMSYISVDPVDASMHKKFHSRAFEGREWPSTGQQQQKQRIVHICSTVDSSGDYIVRVDSSSKLSEKRAVEDMMHLVNTELSAPPENQGWRESPGKGAAFVYISNKRAIGIVIVERVEEQPKPKWMDVASGELLNQEYPLTTTAIMGISRIYTARNFRRRHIAWKLLDIACEEFIFGMKIAKDQVAWSQPSASGGKVADKWCGVDYGKGQRKVLTYIE